MRTNPPSLRDEAIAGVIFVWTLLTVLIVLQAMPCLLVGVSCTWGK